MSAPRMAIDYARFSAGLVVSSPQLRAAIRGIRGIRKNRLDVFYYHRVYRENTQGIYQLGIHQDLFRQQLLDLRRFYRIVPLTDLLAAAHWGTHMEGAIDADDAEDDLASITFDDGYRDNHREAWPVLKELGIPAIIFVVAGLIQTRELLWYDQVKVVCEKMRKDSLTLPRVLGGARVLLSDTETRGRVFHLLLGQFKNLEDGIRREAVAALAAQAKEEIQEWMDRDVLMTWEELREMERDGIRFASHTLSHPLLPQIRNPEILQNELAASLSLLRQNLRSPLPMLAYPGGACSEEVSRAVAAAGYQFAFTTLPGDLREARNPWLLPRRGLGPVSSAVRQRHSRAILRAETEGLFDRSRRLHRYAVPVHASDTASSASPPVKPTSRADTNRGDPGEAHPPSSRPESIVSAAFDDAAESYRSGRRGDPAFEGEAAEMLRMVHLPPRRLIEVGCGVGITALRMVDRGWQVIATDISWGMLQRVRHAAADAGGGRLIGLVQCDVQHLPFRDGVTPLVLCHGVLEYVPNVPGSLVEINRVLASGGSVIATVPNRMAPASWAAHLLRAASQIRQALRHRRLARVPARHRLPRELDAMARQAGLEQRESVIQTFALLPAYLFPRAWLDLNNRIVGALPRSSLFRWWGTQYIARYEKIQ